MELNTKLRGQRHHSNKARYQNKAKVIQKLAPENKVSHKGILKEQPEREDSLTSNWHRYEESPEEDKIDESTNFALLAQAPISHGGHFQFKSDKNVESEFDFETLRKNKMFALDLHLLELRLSTIPFHERCGLDENYLTESQLIEINKRALQKKAEYESYLKLNSITNEFLTQTTCDSGSSKCKELRKTKDMHDDIEHLLATEIQPSVEKSTNINEEISDGVAQVKTKKVSNAHDLKESREDLEQWLDDILNN